MNIALKEWSVVIDALAQGRQRFLLRKGGIAEGKRGFEVKHGEFLLYPTWEHQHADSVRPEFRGLFERARPTHPGTVSFQYFARVNDVLLAPERIEDMAGLDSEYIWAPPYIEMRYGYRPDLPLFVILPRLFRLASVVQIPEDRRYAGCRSWVTLYEEVSREGAVPVESDAEFESSRNSLLTKLSTYGARQRAASSTAD